MKERYEKIKDKLSNKYIRSALFFGFYALFFLFVFGLFSYNNQLNKDDTKQEIEDKWEWLDNNYEYLYEIDFKDENNKDINVTLQGKRFRNKDLYAKYVNKELNSNVYIFYDSVYVEENDKWIIQNGYIKVYPNFDDKLINLDYIKYIINDSELINQSINKDEASAIDEEYLYNQNIDIIVTSASNVISKIKIDTPNVDITLQYQNINKVEDFVIEDKGK